MKSLLSIINSISSNDNEARILLNYAKEFDQCNNYTLIKEEIEIYRDLIRECDKKFAENKNICQESRERIYSKMKSHHYILLLLDKPETYEEEKEYYKYVDIQFESNKNLAEMQKLIAEKQFLRKANEITGQESKRRYLLKILALKNSRECKPGDIEYRFADQIEAYRGNVDMSNIEYLRTI